MRLQCTKTKQSKQIQTPSTICNVFYGKIKINSYKVKNFNESLPGQQVRTEHTRLPSCGLSSLQPEQKFQHSKAIKRKTKHGSKFYCVSSAIVNITANYNQSKWWTLLNTMNFSKQLFTEFDRTDLCSAIMWPCCYEFVIWRHNNTVNIFLMNPLCMDTLQVLTGFFPGFGELPLLQSKILTPTNHPTSCYTVWSRKF